MSYRRRTGATHGHATIEHGAAVSADILRAAGLDPRQMAILAPLMNATLTQNRRREIRQKFVETYKFDAERFVVECFDWSRIPGMDGPTPYQRRALRHLIEDKRVAMYGPHGLGKCQKNGQIVYLATGERVEVESLIGREFSVVGWDSSTGRRTIRAARAADNGPRDCWKIVTDKGRVIERTAEHPLWADREPYRWDRIASANRLRPVASWVPIAELTPGAVVAVPLRANLPMVPIDLDDNEILIAAALIANGGIINGSPDFSHGNPVYAARVCASAQALGVRWTATGPCGYRFAGSVAGHNPLIDRLRAWGLWGQDAHRKDVPGWAWLLDDRQLRLFVGHLFANDGWISTSAHGPRKTNREIGYCSVSESLARSLHSLLLRLGIQAEVRERKTGYARADGTRWRGAAWGVNIHDYANLIAFLDTIPVPGKEDACAAMRTSLARSSPRERQKWRTHGLHEGCVWERVVSVEPIGDHPTVAIEVEHDHTYLTDFIEHNTAFQGWVWHWFVATRDGFDNWKALSTAGSWKQLTAYLWPEMKLWNRYLKWDVVGRAPYDHSSEFLKLSFSGATGLADAIAPTDPTLIEGAHATEILFQYDESKAIGDTLFDATEGAFSQAGPTTGRNAYLVATSTPGDARGRFYSITEGEPEKYDDWKTVHVTFEETVAAGLNDWSWAEKRKKQWGEKSTIYINRVLGRFQVEQANGVLPLTWIEAAVNRWVPEGIMLADGTLDPKTTRRAYGLDPADAGDDMAATCELWNTAAGNIWCAPIDYAGSDDPIATSDRILMLTSGTPNIPIGVDVIGVGAAVPPYLRKSKRNPVPFISTAAATRKDRTNTLEFGNMRAWGWWMLRDTLAPVSEVLVALPPEDDRLHGDLAAPRYNERGGRIYIESKDELRKMDRLGHSTDGADSLIIAMAAGDIGHLGSLDGVKIRSTETRRHKSMRASRFAEADRENRRGDRHRRF